MPVKRPSLGAMALEPVVRADLKGKAAVYQIRDHGRSAIICDAVLLGLEKAGYDVDLCFEDEYCAPTTQVAVFYGFAGKFPKIMREHERAVFIDFGYWGRTRKDSVYHKIAVNDRHPTAYFRTQTPDFTRLDQQGVEIHPYRRGGKKILLIGMSPKAAGTCGYEPGEWERQTADRIRQYTSRPIVYRPKPSDGFAKPIPGTEFGSRRITLHDALDDVHAVVARHSNAAVEALLYGVPVFVEDGVTLGMSHNDLSLIETPYYPDNRREWAADIAWTQWTLKEMATAEPWVHLKNRGVL